MKRSFKHVAFAIAALFVAGCNPRKTDLFPTTASSTSASTGGSGGGGGAAPQCKAAADCGSGKGCCAGSCVDLMASPDHCGTCDVACGQPPGADATCESGVCKLTCLPGYGDCDGLFADGCETNVTVDPQNCSACGKLCLFANADPACKASVCSISACKAPFADCNNDGKDGCEANLGTDPKNCGACASACGSATNSMPACQAGLCAFGGCNTGFDDCNGLPADGCEANLLTDAANCGKCGAACTPLANAATSCTGGACVVGTCAAGFADCDKSVWSGCESELATDVDNCSACGMKCGAVPHGAPKCQGGACAIGACDAGYADCNGDIADGCETNLANDAVNCGACKNACPPVANGTPACTGFQCGIAQCNANFANCFGGPGAGCETSLLTDVDHCGTCAKACPLVANGTRGCAAGMCQVASCSTSYSDCNKDLADGCEASLKTDINNCGACQNVCATPPHATAGCAGGACTLATCNAGYSDCNGNIADGCELNTLVDPSNCGGCGIICGSGTCANSKCGCFKTVLVIADDSGSGSATLGASLTAAGYSVTQTAVPSYQYTGTNPALAGFGAVVILSGGPAATSSNTDMPAAGQTAIANFVNAGNGLVLTEWAAFQVAGGRWKTLAPFVLLTRTASYAGQVQYAVDAAFTSHPVWAGLPASFTFASTSNVGTTTLAPGVTRLAGSPQAVDAVAIRDVAKGRVVHVAHAGNYAPNGWTNANMQKLIANAVGWTARCQ